MIGRIVLLDEIKSRPAAALVVDGQLQDLAMHLLLLQRVKRFVFSATDCIAIKSVQ